jgi:phage baseplate assembly protein W
VTGHYGLPIKFSEILKKKQLRRVSFIESIGFNIRLILRSHYGENRFDYSYGCEVWERDFEVIANQSVWGEELARSIRETLIAHEKRILNTKVEVKISEEEFKSSKGDEVMLRVKRKIEVIIRGNMYNTNEPFRITEVLYISPLSIEEGS